MQFTLLIVALVGFPCALATREARIIGGASVASDTDYPFMGSVRSLALVFHCGAFIYNERWVISAAHCTEGKILATTVVVVGTLGSTLGGTTYTLSDIVRHECYYAETRANDISLLKTQNPISYNAKVQPIALDTTVIGAGSVALALGWGIGLPLLGTLQMLNTTTLTETDCINRFQNKDKNKITANTLCVFKSNTTGLCNGDSGGPLVLGGKVIGVICFGIDCAQGYPDVSTRISSYVPWIESKAGYFNVSGQP